MHLEILCLPTTRLMLENSCFMMQGESITAWPLVCDPTSRVIEWLRYRMGKNLVEVKYSVSISTIGLSGPEVIKLFSCSTQLSTKFILLINVKMPTIVGILTFISMIDTPSEGLKARNFLMCLYFRFYMQLKFRAQLSWAWKQFYNLGAWCQALYSVSYGAHWEHICTSGQRNIGATVPL